MNEEPLRQDADFDRDFWRWHARRELQEAFKALEDGSILFGNWERLFLSAALDHFRRPELPTVGTLCAAHLYRTTKAAIHRPLYAKAHGG
jgi:hypothetical protein